MRDRWIRSKKLSTDLDRGEDTGFNSWHKHKTPLKAPASLERGAGKRMMISGPIRG